MKSLALVFAGVGLVGMLSAAGNADLINWLKDTYEPKTPVLNSAPEAEGLCGRVAPLVRINGANAMGDETAKTIKLTAWKNERVSGQFVVWSKAKVDQLRVKVGELVNEKGRKIDADAVQARFVRYVMAHKELVGDVLDTAERVNLPAKGYRPCWITVTVPAKAKPGLYKAPIEVVGCGGAKVSFNLELNVLDLRLTDAEDWGFFLDLWQHPWAVARYHGAVPFSKAHYELLKPIYQELANAGQKTITTTLTDLPWNHQNYDPYYTMIKHYRHKDGSWTHDYSLFDEYVKFAKSCGLGPQIHCYSMVPWGDRMYYIDAETGDQRFDNLPTGSEKHKQFWAPFLRDFQKHLKKKGWLGQTYIAMDERGPKQMQAVAELIRENAPAIKITMAANQVASNFKGVELDPFCVYLEHANAPAFLEDAKKRKAEGKTSTFYVCCGPHRPNTFTRSPVEEATWLGIYPAAVGFDGFLRWAFCNWPRDPLFDTSYKTWLPGDTFLIYPGMRLSVRWEALRDGIEEFEKIAQLRKAGVDMTKIDALLKSMHSDYKLVATENSGKTKEQVDAIRAAVNEAAAKFADR